MNGRVSLGAFGEVIEVWQTPDMGEARQVAGIVRGLGYKALLSLGAGEKGPSTESGCPEPKIRVMRFSEPRWRASCGSFNVRTCWIKAWKLLTGSNAYN